MAKFWQLKPIHSSNLFIDDSVKHGQMWKSTRVMALLIDFSIKSRAANGPLKAEWVKFQCLRCPFSKEASQVLNLRGNMKERHCRQRETAETEAFKEEAPCWE